MGQVHGAETVFQVLLVLNPDSLNLFLQRRRKTRQQVGLNRQERRANVADAFTATLAVRDQSLLIIDDVFTTGATMMACAEAARAAGAGAVYGMTLALPANTATSGSGKQSDLHTRSYQ